MTEIKEGERIVQALEKLHQASNSVTAVVNSLNFLDASGMQLDTQTSLKVATLNANTLMEQLQQLRVILTSESELGYEERKRQMQAESKEELFG